MSTWIVMIAVGVGSYALRLVPVVVGGRWIASARVERAIAHAGTAALAALVAAGLRRDAGGPADALALALMVVVALVLAVRGASLPRVLLAGALVHAVVAGCAWLAT